MSNVSDFTKKLEKEYTEYLRDKWEEEQRQNEELILKAREREREE